MTRLLALPVVLSVAGWASPPTPQPPSAAPKLAIELKVKETELNVGASLDFTAVLVNEGEESVTVLLPGDGSDVGWRTPVVRWTPPVGEIARCGNMSPPTSAEFAVLAPGQRQPLVWLWRPALTMPGEYAVSVEIENIPTMSWGTGSSWMSYRPMPTSDPRMTPPIPIETYMTPEEGAALERVARSAPFKARSNVVRVRVKQQD